MREWRLCQGNEAIMSEGHTCRCSWSLTTTGYRLWVVADPALAREDAVFAQAAAELGYAILDKTGDGEAQTRVRAPATGCGAAPAGVASLPTTPRVAPLGATARHSRCETCGFISVYVEQVGNEPNGSSRCETCLTRFLLRWPWAR